MEWKEKEKQKERAEKEKKAEKYRNTTPRDNIIMSHNSAATIFYRYQSQLGL